MKQELKSKLSNRQQKIMELASDEAIRLRKLLTQEEKSKLNFR